MSKKTPRPDRYAEAIRDALALVATQAASISKTAEASRLGTSFLAGADLATRLIHDGVRSGLVQGFARRQVASRRVGHA